MIDSTKNSYYKEKNSETRLEIRKELENLPSWFGDFIRARETTLQPYTMYIYCVDARIFLEYLSSENIRCMGKAIKDITTDDIDSLTLRDLEIYTEYISYYITPDGKEHSNESCGKARKVASLRSLFKYLYKKGLISSNPSTLLDTPKIHEKAIVRLTTDEIRNLINLVDSGEGLSDRAKKYQEHTRARDKALLVLFLTTGMRVSELVGLNISHINFEDNSLIIMRKGGNESILYFGEETRDVLLAYLEEREAKEKLNPDSPLFLSTRGTRLKVRSIQDIVKKYAKIISPLKKITPHKLRSTYGTQLYHETGDIYLVADVLGHKDVNTTRKHYASMTEDRRRSAAGAVRVTSDSEEYQNLQKRDE